MAVVVLCRDADMGSAILLREITLPGYLLSMPDFRLVWDGGSGRDWFVLSRFLSHYAAFFTGLPGTACEWEFTEAVTAVTAAGWCGAACEVTEGSTGAF